MNLNLQRAASQVCERDGYLPPALPPRTESISVPEKEGVRAEKRPRPAAGAPLTCPGAIIAVPIKTSRQNLRRDREDANAASRTQQVSAPRTKTSRRKKKRDSLYAPLPSRRRRVVIGVRSMDGCAPRVRHD